MRTLLNPIGAACAPDTDAPSAADGGCQAERKHAVSDRPVPRTATTIRSRLTGDDRPRYRRPALTSTHETCRSAENWNVWQPARFEDTLAQTRFGGSRTVYAPGRPDLIKDVDAVVLNYSMSYAAHPLFGNQRSDFEADLRRLLLVRPPGGLFWDWRGYRASDRGQAALNRSPRCTPRSESSNRPEHRHDEPGRDSLLWTLESPGDERRATRLAHVLYRFVAGGETGRGLPLPSA